MKPSEVRRTILEDHATLRARFADLQDLLAALRRDGDPASAADARREQVRELAAALRQRFLRHLELEEGTLVPALRRTDSWGDERARRVLAEHADQRRRLDELLEHMGDPACSDAALAVELETLVEDLLTDMEHEERSVLSERLLRDDVITLGEPE